MESCVAFLHEAESTGADSFTLAEEWSIASELVRGATGEGAAGLTGQGASSLRDVGAPQQQRRRGAYILAALDTDASRAEMLAALRERKLFQRTPGLLEELVRSVSRASLSESDVASLVELSDPTITTNLLYSGVVSRIGSKVTAQVLGLLGHDDPGVRRAAAHVIAVGGLKSEEEAAALLGFLESAESSPRGDERLGQSGMSVGEQAVYSLTRQVAATPSGVDRLRQWSGRSRSELVKQYSVVALAELSEERGVADRVREILLRATRPNLRASAAAALGAVGDKRDIPTLEALARSDATVAYSDCGEYYPVRAAAKQAAMAIQARLSGN